MFVVLSAHTVTVFVDDAAITPTPPPTVTPARTPTSRTAPVDRRIEYLDLDMDEIFILCILYTNSAYHALFRKTNLES